MQKIKFCYMCLSSHFLGVCFNLTTCDVCGKHHITLIHRPSQLSDSGVRKTTLSRNSRDDRSYDAVSSVSPSVTHSTLNSVRVPSFHPSTLPKTMYNQTSQLNAYRDLNMLNTSSPATCNLNQVSASSSTNSEQTPPKTFWTSSFNVNAKTCLKTLPVFWDQFVGRS